MPSQVVNVVEVLNETGLHLLLFKHIFFSIPTVQKHSYFKRKKKWSYLNSHIVLKAQLILRALLRAVWSFFHAESLVPLLSSRGSSASPHLWVKHWEIRELLLYTFSSPWQLKCVELEDTNNRCLWLSIFSNTAELTMSHYGLRQTKHPNLTQKDWVDQEFLYGTSPGSRSIVFAKGIPFCSKRTCKHKAKRKQNNCAFQTENTIYR